MENAMVAPAPGRHRFKPAPWILAAALAFNLWAVSVGWMNLSLPGVEFRQTQTAISAHFIQQENNFSLAYPTPVLGKPWSVPLEFPLYQWSVVVLSNATGMPLTQAGRLVSVLCFYLALPAVFLLLADWEAAKDRRCLILGLILCSPFYVFYARAFLMETMALMLSVWFLLAYGRWVQPGGRWGWLLVANLLGAGAALVKITTFALYLMPAACGTLALMRRPGPPAGEPGWAAAGRLIGRGLAATILPVAAGWWWIQYSDAVKRLNPLSQFLLSKNTTAWVFGTSETRFAARVWQGHWTIISQTVLWLPLLVAGGILVLLVPRARRGPVALCLGCFLGIQLLFPELYAWHEYYYVANALLLLVALGLGLTALLDSRLPRWAGWMVVAGVFAGQAWHFISHYYPEQRRDFQGGSGFTQALNKLTGPNDVLIVSGEDWNPMTPYYARRRAAMLRWGEELDEAHLRAAFAALKGESIGAMVAPEGLGEVAPLYRLAAEYFGIELQPVLNWRGLNIYFPTNRLDEVQEFLRTHEFDAVRLLPGARPPAQSLAGAWHETKALRRSQRASFLEMQPQPVRFFSTFGLRLNVEGARVRFDAHPLTQLCFAVPAGRRHLQTEIGIDPGAYENLSAADATDGIELKISLVQSGREEKLIYSRSINPRDNPADRGALPVSLDFSMPEGAELKVSVEAGPQNNNTRDWAFLGRLTIGETAR